MIFKDVALILGNTARSKAYLQLMIKNDIFPAVCLFLVQNEKDLSEVFSKKLDFDGLDYFDINESLLETVKNNNINYYIVGTDSINSEECILALKNLNCSYLIYSGYGGVILKKPLFELDKTWIHVHAGLLPEFRGSTTIYYSMLEQDCIGATAIILNEKIDCGNIISRKKFPYPVSSTNIDYIYDPYIRAQLLVEILKNFAETKCFANEKQIDAEGVDYYVIHPVLKHLAMLGMK